MHSARKLLAVAGTIVVLAVVIPLTSASASTALQPIHITKECSGFTGSAGSFCTITGSDLSAIPVGTKVYYRGPVISDPNFLSSRVVAKGRHGSRAYGYCSAIYSPYHGVCTFWRGTGSLKGFHASVDVTLDDSGVFHWDGTYLFD
jgi:hypothetical protein